MQFCQLQQDLQMHDHTFQKSLEMLMSVTVSKSRFKHLTNYCAVELELLTRQSESSAERGGGGGGGVIQALWGQSRAGHLPNCLTWG